MQPNRTRRKLAIATWDAPREGNMYGKLTVDMEEALRYLDWKRARCGEKITVTHLCGKAVATALQAAPGLNGVIRLGTFVPNPTVDIAFLVALEGGRDLAKAKVRDVASKSLEDIARELRGLALRLHAGQDADFRKAMDTVRRLPTWLLKPLIRLTGYVGSVFGVSIPALGIEARPLGSCVITNVGVFGLDEGYAPPTPFAHAPVYVLLGAVKPAAAVLDGTVVARRQMTICATLDHRYLDGAQAALLARVTRRVLENPWELESMPGRPADG